MKLLKRLWEWLTRKRVRAGSKFHKGDMLYRKKDGKYYSVNQ